MTRPTAPILLLMLGFASPAWADATRATAPAGPEEEARPFIEAGLANLRARRYDQALAAFQEAFEIFPAPEVEARLGLAAQGLDRWVEAETHLENALRAASDPWVEKNRAAIEKVVLDLEGKLGWLVVEGSPKGAIVKVDDIERGLLPRVGPLRVTARAHEVVATLGTGSRSAEALVAARSTVTVNLVVPVPLPPPSQATAHGEGPGGPAPQPPPRLIAGESRSGGIARTEPSAWYKWMAWTSLLPAASGMLAGFEVGAVALTVERCSNSFDCPHSPGLLVLGTGAAVLAETYGLVNLVDLVAPAPLLTTRDGRRRKVAEWLGIGAAVGMGATSYLLIDNDGYGSSYRKNLGFANIPLAVLAATTSIGSLIADDRRSQVSATMLYVPGFVGMAGIF